MWVCQRVGCGQRLVGKPEKRFCSDRCRTAFGRARRASEHTRALATARAEGIRIVRADGARLGQAVQLLLEAQELLDAARRALLQD